MGSEMGREVSGSEVREAEETAVPSESWVCGVLVEFDREEGAAIGSGVCARATGYSESSIEIWEGFGAGTDALEVVEVAENPSALEPGSLDLTAEAENRTV